MRFSNPAIRRLDRYAAAENEERASYKGVALKTLFFAGVTLLSAIASYFSTILFLSPMLLIAVSVICPIAALVCSLIAAFAPRTAAVSGTLYTIFMGASLGFLSCVFSLEYSGVVFAALIATVATFAVMAILFSAGIVRVGRKFRSFIISALIAVMLTNLLLFVFSLISPALNAAIYGNSLLSIGISAVMVVLAALTLLFDFSTVSIIVENGMSKTYEWSAAFGLAVTIIWLYMQFLRLFAKIASRSK